MALESVVLSIGVGSLAAVVYTLRHIVMMDKKLNKIMKHMGISEN